MALTKIPRGLLDTGIADSSDATAITIDSSEIATFAAKIHANKGVNFYTTDDQTNFWAQYTHTDDSLRFNYNGLSNDEIVVNTSGNVGIGTASPTSPNSVNTFLHIHNADHSSLVMSDDSNTWEIVSNNNLTVRDGTTTRITVDTSGNVGIGTASPDNLLHIKTTGSTPSIELEQDAGTSYKGLIKLAGNDLEIRGSSGVMEFYNGGNNDGDSATLAMTIDSSQRVGIKTSIEADGTAMTSPLTISGANDGGNIFEAHRTANSIYRQYMSTGGLSYIDIYGTTPTLKIRTSGTDHTNFTSTGITGSFFYASTNEYNGNLDNLKTTGFYRSKNSNTNNPSYAYYSVMVYGNQGNVTAQIATLLSGPATYVRSFNTSWTSWVRIDD